MNKRTLKWILSWFAMAAGFVIFFSAIDWNYYLLYRSGIRTSARLTKMEPNNHRSLYYSYKVGDSTYSGSGRDGFGNPYFDSLHVNDSVTVYYLPAQPQISCLGIPKDILMNELMLMLMIATIFPTFILFVIGFKKSGLKTA